MTAKWWINRLERQEGKKKIFAPKQIELRYSDVSSRLLYVFDDERGIYPVLKTQIHTDAARAARDYSI